jgi:ribosome biogenesis GTPase
LLDKLLIAAEVNSLKPVICFNKKDLCSQEKMKEISDVFKNTGYRIIFTSKKDEESIEELKSVLKGKLNVFSGPSGVGKSSMMNAVQPDFHLQTGEISEKLKRGKHTTRHAEIYKLSFGGYAVDTPGFSSFEIEGIGEYDLGDCYPEIKKFSSGCRFDDCLHYKEPGCVIKDAVSNGLISETRYENYSRILEEIKNTKKTYEK